MMYAIAMTLA